MTSRRGLCSRRVVSTNFWPKEPVPPVTRIDLSSNIYDCPPVLLGSIRSAALHANGDAERLERFLDLARFDIGFRSTSEQPRPGDVERQPFNGSAKARACPPVPFGFRPVTFAQHVPHDQRQFSRTGYDRH